MSYGIAAFGTDSKITFHSDYSSIIYAGEFSKNADPARPTYTGSYHIAIDGATKTSNYDMGWIIQYKINLNVDFLVPFYKPAFNGQEIAIMDVINEGTTWVVNLLYSGNSLQYPYVYAFAPLTEMPSSSITLNNYGIVVYDASGDVTYTDSVKPLRIDDVIAITHGTTIKTNSKGTCSSNNCHVSFAPNRSTTYNGSVNNTTSKLYHIIPSAYGGLAYENGGSGREYSCDWFGVLSRPYAWSYKSWASFRGTVKHPRGGATHVAGWQGDFAGAAYQYHDGDCGFTGFFGALVGVFLVVFTGGAALAVIGGALAGFAIGSLTTGTIPSLKAYDTDETFDTSNTVNLLVTDTSYYGITNNGDVNINDRLTYLYSHTSLDASNWTQWIYANGIYGLQLTVYIDGALPVLLGGIFGSTAPASTVTSYTLNDSTYYRGALQTTEYVVPGYTTLYVKRYKVAVAQG